MINENTMETNEVRTIEILRALDELPLINIDAEDIIFSYGHKDRCILNDGIWVEGDYHLLSIAGRLEEDTWVNDTETSPCIDAGDPTSIFYTEPSPNGEIINQGAYGGTAAASD